MNIVFFTHPLFLGHQSMPRFANMLAEGMTKRGHQVELWSPAARFVNYHKHPTLKKWLGYIDQYVAFPRQVRDRLKIKSKDTLFVFTDQALGPWVPLVAALPHVVHCHDFMALRSALGEIPENPTGWTGRQYQNMIRSGFSKGKNFISVSKKTQEELHRFLFSKPEISEVVYNGLNQSFSPSDALAARKSLSERTKLDLAGGYFLHVGGNQWYKNRSGIIEMYDAFRSNGGQNIPLLLMGERPAESIIETQQRSPYKNDIYFLSGIEDKFVRLAYSGASVFLFPSLAEGFGWPIAEAMASGCSVITTNEAPMTEVAGEAAFLVDRKPHDLSKAKEWAESAASVMHRVLNLSSDERKKTIQSGIENAKRFNPDDALTRIESIYTEVLNLNNSN